MAWNKKRRTKRRTFKPVPKLDSEGKQVFLKSEAEVVIYNQLKKAKIPIRYEPIRIKYTLPVKSYTPDYIIPNGIIIESKGLFESKARTKHLRIQKLHPELDVRFVFTKPHTKLSPLRETTYASWAEKHGFKWAQGPEIPIEWLKEKSNGQCLKQDVKLSTE